MSFVILICEWRFELEEAAVTLSVLTVTTFFRQFLLEQPFPAISSLSGDVSP